MPQIVSLSSLPIKTNRADEIRRLEPGQALVYTREDMGADLPVIRSRLSHSVAAVNRELRPQGKRVATRILDNGVAVFIREDARHAG